MLTTAFVCGLVFAFIINVLFHTRRLKKTRQRIANEEWTRQARINALYGRASLEERDHEES